MGPARTWEQDLAYKEESYEPYSGGNLLLDYIIARRGKFGAGL
jgi:hypothetical protein